MVEVSKKDPPLKFFGCLKENGYLSNFYSKAEMKDFELVIDGHNWHSTEHYYQAQKFNIPNEAS